MFLFSHRAGIESNIRSYQHVGTKNLRKTELEVRCVRACARNIPGKWPKRNFVQVRNLKLELKVEKGKNRKNWIFFETFFNVHLGRKQALFSSVSPEKFNNRYLKNTKMTIILMMYGTATQELLLEKGDLGGCLLTTRENAVALFQVLIILWKLLITIFLQHHGPCRTCQLPGRHPESTQLYHDMPFQESNQDQILWI